MLYKAKSDTLMRSRLISFSHPGILSAFLLVSCVASTAIALLAQTPTPSVLSVHVLYPTPTLGPTPTFVLASQHPTKEEIEWLLFDHRYPLLRDLTLEHWKALAASRFGDLVWQVADINNDEKPEIIAYNAIDSFEPYLAILGRTADDWEIWLYTSTSGRYCGITQAIVKTEQVVAEFTTCGGGTGIRTVIQESKWIQCRQRVCNVVRVDEHVLQ